MKLKLKLLAVGLLAVALVLPQAVSAQSRELNDQQAQNIRENCLPAKNILNQIHTSDLLLRVNRGQLYESLHTKLMNRFNSRVAASGHDNSRLVAASNEYAKTLNQFRSNYMAYQDSLSNSIRIDCSRSPVNFYDSIAESRSKRFQVRDDVKKLNQQLDQYRSLVEEFSKTLGGAN